MKKKEKKNKLQVEETYKEILNRYDLKFIYKDRIKLVFILPEEEKEFKDILKSDIKGMTKILKLFYFAYKLLGATKFNYAARENGVDFLLEETAKKHQGEVFIEAIED